MRKMKKYCHFVHLIEVAFLLLFTVTYVSSNAIGVIGSEEGGLYNSSDHVVILNTTNFKSYVYNSTSSWIVEFYSSWCGHCIHFAPIWKSFARNVSPWKKVVRVGVIDCANDDNNPTCREFEVMHYPTIKFFSVNSKSGYLGLELEKGREAESMQNTLIKQLEKEQQEGRGSSWPNIVPYRKTELESIWKAVTDNVKYIFLIFEASDSYVGTSVILDIQAVPELRIRRVTSANELLCVTAKVTKFPSVILLQRDRPQKSISIKNSTREGIRKSIQDYMNSVGIHIEETDNSNEQLKITNSVAEKAFDSNRPENIENPIQHFGDVVFQIDLENTLRYSLMHEISLSKVIDGEKMLALKEYLNVLKSYFPVQGNGASYLRSIHSIIKNKNSISGKSFRELVSETEDTIRSVFSEKHDWIGCLGSSKIYRGYPCGLWTMFHTLTVNFENQHSEQMEYEPGKVLRAMYGYIKNFFGCTECSQHFVEMANRKQMFDVKSEDESILWLWRAHNEVNQRLSGAESEDPQHKKIQYPAKSDCPLCRDENNNWNENEVLRYLKNKYSRDKINFYGTSLKTTHNDNDDMKLIDERLVANSAASHRKLGWDFNIFDISICVVLYIISASILILVCIKFAFKRSYKKKPYVYSLFSRV